MHTKEVPISLYLHRNVYVPGAHRQSQTPFTIYKKMLLTLCTRWQILHSIRCPMTHQSSSRPYTRRASAVPFVVTILVSTESHPRTVRDKGEVLGKGFYEAHGHGPVLHQYLLVDIDQSTHLSDDRPPDRSCLA